ncbi:hypothetical protein [Nostoc favosum]|uniref:Uncharacterized protein n=1 Tax=Nostoc favosum CHAB5714 TaxID=2780399 RepID=A0ABS8IHK8_9NOSO|nr:hypothetical protein [Nostoc favosum]MCC5603752.1 hypothetical protein [Nostoc favosum CHAB5714]
MGICLLHLSEAIADRISRGVQAPKFIYGGKPQANLFAVMFRSDFECTF